MQRTSHAIIITGAMIVFFMHKRLNLMAILDNWLMPPFILMTLRTVPCLTQFEKWDREPSPVPFFIS